MSTLFPDSSSREEALFMAIIGDREIELKTVQEFCATSILTPHPKYEEYEAYEAAGVKAVPCCLTFFSHPRRPEVAAGRLYSFGNAYSIGVGTQTDERCRSTARKMHLMILRDAENGTWL